MRKPFTGEWALLGFEKTTTDFVRKAAAQDINSLYDHDVIPSNIGIRTADEALFRWYLGTNERMREALTQRTAEMVSDRVPDWALVSMREVALRGAAICIQSATVLEPFIQGYSLGLQEILPAETKVQGFGRRLRMRRGEPTGWVIPYTKRTQAEQINGDGARIILIADSFEDAFLRDDAERRDVLVNGEGSELDTLRHRLIWGEARRDRGTGMDQYEYLCEVQLGSPGELMGESVIDVSTDQGEQVFVDWLDLPA